MHNIRCGLQALAAGLLLSLLVPACAAAQSAEPALSLKDTIELALTANLQIKRSGEEINAAQANRQREHDQLPADVWHRDTTTSAATSLRPRPACLRAGTS